ncbi:MAG: hypothetical protein CM15mP106_2770 [Candidatus Neomarinimicrobiota bacterium]|nr:MAG: hypothetical protein CM15mP106_2770 [Candidatus Neomarinimicrobiota bacterium]
MDTIWALYIRIVCAGILPYPITFLVTDLISELYGRKKADQVVFSGLIASMFVMGVVAWRIMFNTILGLQ